MKRFLLISLMLFVAAAVIGNSAAAQMKEAKKHVVQNKPIVENGFNNVLPKQSPEVVYPTTIPSDGIVIGTTDYDYGFNSGGPREITVNAENKVHITFMERDLDAVAPNNRLAQKYVYWNGTALTNSYPVAKSVATTGFGGVDCWLGGSGDNYGVWCAGSPLQFGMSDGAGAATFQVSTLPSYAGPDDPEITVDNNRQYLWYYYPNSSSSKTNYSVLKSTDYGTSWTLSDTALLSHLKYSSTFGIGSLDNPVLVAPNGNLYLTVCVSVAQGNGGVNLFPIGTTKDADSCDGIGYFKSTDVGSTWTWTRIGTDGQKIIMGSDTVYQLFENFAQFTAYVDWYNVLHVVASGYFKKAIRWAGGLVDSAVTQFGILYWNSTNQYWKLISNNADRSYAAYNNFTTAKSFNSWGMCYPTIGGRDKLFYCFWSQPLMKNNIIDTTYDGFYKYDLWYTISIDGGSTWSVSTKWPNTTTAQGHYACLGGITKPSPISFGHTTHVVYLNDTTGGTSIADIGPGKRTKVDWIYRIIGIPDNVDIKNSSPYSFALHQNYPNPFNPSTTIRYDLPTRSSVRLAIYNTLGQIVKELINVEQSAGPQSVVWYANVPSGMYFYRLEAASLNYLSKRFVETKKMLLMR
jgi:hypothetical protein